MPDRLVRNIRAVCLGLAALLVLRLGFLVFHRDPLDGVRVPIAPHWQPSDETPGGTNPVVKMTSPSGTNLVSTNPIGSATNTMAARLTGTNGVSTNLVAIQSVGTNNPVGTNNLAGTNNIAATNRTVTNLTVTNPMGTNLVGTNIMGTNLAGNPRPPSPGGMPPGMPPGMPFGGPGAMRGGGPPKPPRPLSPLLQARIDRITQSEMLAPVVRPPPMALLGIAGRDAFIRTPSGQTTLLREGAESDGIKILRIGTNRVLLEQAGEKKELTIFSGLGSESLLPK